MAIESKSVLQRFYDILDGVTEGDPVEFFADDCEFEMMFPSAAGIPNERVAGGKREFKQFMDGLAARGSRFQQSGSQRRHNISTLTEADGIELMLGRGMGGRRNGDLVAAAQGDPAGKLRRYIVLMTTVRFPDLPERATTITHPSVITRFFDLLDGVAEGDPVDLLSEDYEFEMIFPGLGGPPDERIAGGKEDFRRFMQELAAQGRGPRMSGPVRRHHIKTVTVADGIEFMVGEALGGRRNGTILAAAQQDPDGKLRRYAVGMAAVAFPHSTNR